MGFDSFTRRRLARFVETFRGRTGQLPTGADFELEGFSREELEAAVKAGLVESFYVTLTSGTIVKGYKLGSGPAGR